MLHPPQSLVSLGASFLSARTTRRLRAPGWALAAQRRHATRLRRHFAGTAYGRAHGIESGMDDRAWRERVPLRLPEGLAPFIERMKRGEADVLWPGRCRFFALSAGSTGAPRHLPVTKALLDHFRHAGLDSLAFYTARAGTGVFRGKHLLLGGANPLAPLSGAGEQPALAGELGDIAALHLPGWVENQFYEPGAEIARIKDWPTKIEAIARRCVGLDIRALAGIPNWLLVLASAVLAEQARRGGKRAQTLREVWPGLECLVHGGVPVGPYAAELHAVCGPGVHFHEVYAAAEAFVAAQDAEPEAGLRLLADAGVHYEFLPLADYDEARLLQLGPRALPLEGVRAGVDYVLILTTPGGLARYLPGDVVRFLSTEPARLVHVGRTRQRLNAFGERVSERELTEALSTVCRRHGWQVVNFHVAPHSAGSLTSARRGAHEWWLELRAGSEITPTGPVIARLLDAELRRLDADYDAKRKTGALHDPIVRLVMPGVFEQWQRATGRWGGQHKMPRCRADRQVADELAKYSPFHDAV